MASLQIPLAIWSNACGLKVNLTFPYIKCMITDEKRGFIFLGLSTGRILRLSIERSEDTDNIDTMISEQQQECHQSITLDMVLQGHSHPVIALHLTHQPNDQSLCPIPVLLSLDDHGGLALWNVSDGRCLLYNVMALEGRAHTLLPLCSNIDHNHNIGNPTVQEEEAEYVILAGLAPVVNIIRVSTLEIVHSIAIPDRQWVSCMTIVTSQSNPLLNIPGTTTSSSSLSTENNDKDNSSTLLSSSFLDHNKIQVLMRTVLIFPIGEGKQPLAFEIDCRIGRPLSPIYYLNVIFENGDTLPSKIKDSKESSTISYCLNINKGEDGKFILIDCDRKPWRGQLNWRIHSINLQKLFIEQQLIKENNESVISNKGVIKKMIQLGNGNVCLLLCFPGSDDPFSIDHLKGQKMFLVNVKSVDELIIFDVEEFNQDKFGGNPFWDSIQFASWGMNDTIIRIAISRKGQVTVDYHKNSFGWNLFANGELLPFSKISGKSMMLSYLTLSLTFASYIDDGPSITCSISWRNPSDGQLMMINGHSDGSITISPFLDSFIAKRDENIISSTSFPSGYHTHPVTFLQIDPTDEQRLISSDTCGAIHLWHLLQYSNVSSIAGSNVSLLQQRPTHHYHIIHHHAPLICACRPFPRLYLFLDHQGRLSFIDILREEDQPNWYWKENQRDGWAFKLRGIARYQSDKITSIRWTVNEPENPRVAIFYERGHVQVWNILGSMCEIEFNVRYAAAEDATPRNVQDEEVEGSIGNHLKPFTEGINFPGEMPTQIGMFRSAFAVDEFGILSWKPSMVGDGVQVMILDIRVLIDQCKKISFNSSDEGMTNDLKRRTLTNLIIWTLSVLLPWKIEKISTIANQLGIGMPKSFICPGIIAANNNISILSPNFTTARGIYNCSPTMSATYILAIATIFEIPAGTLLMGPGWERLKDAFIIKIHPNHINSPSSSPSLGSTYQLGFSFLSKYWHDFGEELRNASRHLILQTLFVLSEEVINHMVEYWRKLLPLSRTTHGNIVHAVAPVTSNRSHHSINNGGGVMDSPSSSKITTHSMSQSSMTHIIKPSPSLTGTAVFTNALGENRRSMSRAAIILGIIAIYRPEFITHHRPMTSNSSSTIEDSIETIDVSEPISDSLVSLLQDDRRNLFRSAAIELIGKAFPIWSNHIHGLSLFRLLLGWLSPLVRIEESHYGHNSNPSITTGGQDHSSSIITLHLVAPFEHASTMDTLQSVRQTLTKLLINATEEILPTWLGHDFPLYKTLTDKWTSLSVLEEALKEDKALNILGPYLLYIGDALSKMFSGGGGGINSSDGTTSSSSSSHNNYIMSSISGPSHSLSFVPSSSASTVINESSLPGQFSALSISDPITQSGASSSGHGSNSGHNKLAKQWCIVHPLIDTMKKIFPTVIMGGPGDKFLAISPYFDLADHLANISSSEAATKPLNNINSKFITSTGLTEGPNIPAGSITYYPIHIYDYTAILSASSSGKGTVTSRVLEGHTDPVTAMSFSPDGKMLLSYSAGEATVRWWPLVSVSSIVTGVFNSILGGGGGGGGTTFENFTAMTSTSSNVGHRDSPIKNNMASLGGGLASNSSSNTIKAIRTDIVDAILTETVIAKMTCPNEKKDKRLMINWTIPTEGESQQPTASIVLLENKSKTTLSGEIQ